MRVRQRSKRQRGLLATCSRHGYVINVVFLLLLLVGIATSRPTSTKGLLHHFRGHTSQVFSHNHHHNGNNSAAAKQQSTSSVNPPRVNVPLVTGCGRGGTHATAAMLSELGGVTGRHEGFQQDAISVGWMYGAHVKAAETLGWDWPPAGRYPFERQGDAVARLEQLRSFEPVVLLVRHPLQVIASVRRCFCASGTRDVGTVADERSW